jgi:hypothetical protein
MTPEEARQKLKDAGIPVGEPWTTTKEKTVKSPLIERQKVHLRKLEGVLEQQIEQDKARVSDLHVKLMKLKHGGGQ